MAIRTHSSNNREPTPFLRNDFSTITKSKLAEELRQFTKISIKQTTIESELFEDNISKKEDKQTKSGTIIIKNKSVKYLNKPKKIVYIDTPSNIRKQYQYYTQANINRLRKVGYKKKFFSLSEGIEDYITNYLRVS